MCPLHPAALRSTPGPTGLMKGGGVYRVQSPCSYRDKFFTCCQNVHTRKQKQVPHIDATCHVQTAACEKDFCKTKEGNTAQILSSKNSRKSQKTKVKAGIFSLLFEIMQRQREGPQKSVGNFEMPWVR